MKFKVGDVIKGKEGNGYGVTNGEMTKAKVIEVFNHYSINKMRIEILDHREIDRIGGRWTVKNNCEQFELCEDTELDKLQRKLEKHQNKVIEIKEKIKELTKINVGDKVTVINNGLLYTSYISWVDRNIDESELKYCYDVMNQIENGTVCEVLHISQHTRSSRDTLAYIRELATKRCYIIHINGLQKC